MDDGEKRRAWTYYFGDNTSPIGVAIPTRRCYAKKPTLP